MSRDIATQIAKIATGTS